MEISIFGYCFNKANFKHTKMIFNEIYILASYHKVSLVLTWGSLSVLQLKVTLCPFVFLLGWFCPSELYNIQVYSGPSFFLKLYSMAPNMSPCPGPVSLALFTLQEKAPQFCCAPVFRYSCPHLYFKLVSWRTL